MPPNDSQLLGPFIGNVSAFAATIWLQIPNLVKDEARSVFVTLHEDKVDAPVFQTGVINAAYADLNVGIGRFDSLKADTVYYYKLWQDAEHKTALDTGLTENDLHFRTLPADGFDDQLDFLLMSCHNPETSPNDGADGFAVWARMPEIIDQNKNVRFAILAGDQVYGDEVEVEVRKEPDLRKRQDLYFGVYRKFWDNIHYRKVLCSLPAFLMWDDHDLTDGWGSREDSFPDKKSTTFEPDWLRLKEAALSVFKQMQASRNPEPLSEDYADGFDFCFKIGRAGFAVPDLRSNRNIRLPQIMLPAQLKAIRKWVNANTKDLDVLFFVSTVVFSHGAPQVEQGILKYWLYVLDFANWLGKFSPFKGLVNSFQSKVGDLRDDINDSWGAEKNAKEADLVLDFLFEVQNPPDQNDAVNVVILSGDIHTPGYSTIFSADIKHQAKAIIPHIVATPVAYEPFSWIGEAVFRHLTRTVDLGIKKIYAAQVSHHFCYRNVVVVSLRTFPGAKDDEPEMHLKVKYYLEDFPEPQIMLFDLNRSSHRENIGWAEIQPIQPLP